MAKLRRLFALVLAFCLLSGLSAEVILTDEQAAELDETLTQLEITLNEQATTINDLKTQNEQLQDDSKNKQKQLDEQNKTIKTLSSSYKKRNIFSILQNILIAIVSCAGGILIGFLL